MPDTKKCGGKCGQTKPVEEFGISRAKSDGRDYQCLECRKAYTRARRWAAEGQGDGSMLTPAQHAAEMQRANLTRCPKGCGAMPWSDELDAHVATCKGPAKSAVEIAEDRRDDAPAPYPKLARTW